MTKVLHLLPPPAVSTATYDELPIVMEIIDEAAKWLLAMGIRQWETPPPSEACESLREHLRAGLIYLAREPGSPEAIGRLLSPACTSWLCSSWTCAHIG